MARVIKPKRAIVYVRQSTKKEESISPETQVEHAVTHCKRLGYEIVGDPIQDLNLSGRTFKQRSIAPIIDRIANKEADVVVVWKWSRWGRNLVESLLCLAELKQAGGVLESATEPIDASTPAGRFSVTQMLAIAEFESDRIGESWRDAKRSMVFKKFLPPTGGPRFGYIYADRVYQPDPDVAPLLRSAYMRYVAGASFHSITLTFRAHGVGSSRGNQVTEKMVKWAMDSGFAAGLIRLDKPEALLTPEEMDEYELDPGETLWLPGSWEPVIDDDLWRQYQARRSAVRRLPDRAKNPVQRLSSFVRCGGCHRPMIFRADRRRWSCQTQSIKMTDPSKECGIKCTIDKDEVDTFVLNWLRSFEEASSETSMQLILKRAHAQRAGKNIAALEREVARHENRRNNLLELAADGAFSSAEIRDKMKEIKGEIETAKENLAAGRRRVAINDLPTNSDVKAIAAGWDQMPPEVTNKGLAEVLDSVTVYPFRENQRVIILGVWDAGRDLPVAEAPDLAFDEGRTCLGCRQWKPRSEFYVRTRNSQLMSRCKQCKADTHRNWREEQARLRQG